MLKNLLIITQKVDEQDDLLGFFMDWIREFSKKFDSVSVITLAKGTYSFPSNVEVFSLGKEKCTSKYSQLITFYKLLFTLIPKSNGIFAHMSPVFVIASWPVAFLLRKKIIFWYLHRSVTFKLKVAEKMSYKIVTAAKESLKFKSNKIIETGHGININKFKTDRDWSLHGSLRILSVGRISKIKNYETLLEAAKILKDGGLDFKIKIIGKPVMAGDNSYLDSLKALKEKLELGDSVEFVGFIPYDKIVEYYKKSDIVIGLTPDGGIDKTILEGMASGCIVLTSNTANKKYLGDYSDKLIFNYQDPISLAGRISVLAELSPENKKSRSDFMVQSVSENHRLENLISRIAKLL